MATFDPKRYLGTAAHYRRGRPPYSRHLETRLVAELRLGGRGRVLDVGCGPGSLTVRLAPLFDHAIGLDPDADMLAAARSAAAERGVVNVEWVLARGEDLPDVAPGPYRLVTFGQSFHWTDQLTVAQIVYDLLEPDGAVVMLTHTVEGRPQPSSPGHPPIPHDELRALVARYLGSGRHAGPSGGALSEPTFQDVLTRAGFEAREAFLPGDPDVVRDIDGVISGYLSMSYAAPHLFGERLDQFVAEARALLQRMSAGGLFWDWPGDTVLVIGEKVGS